MNARALPAETFERVLVTLNAVATAYPEIPLVANGNHMTKQALMYGALVRDSGEPLDTWKARVKAVKTRRPLDWAIAADGAYTPGPDPTAEECDAALAAWELRGRDVAMAAAIIGVSPETFHRRLRIAQERERQSACAGTPGFIVRQKSVAYDAEGAVKGEWLKEGPAPNQSPGGVDEGPERDGGGGYVVKGVSTLYDGAGNVRGQWVKTKLDDLAASRAFRDAVAEEMASYQRVDPLPPPPSALAHLLNLYTLTDCHVGMLAWRREGGEDWDLRIAERVLFGCFEQMIAAAPAAGTCVVNQLGDFLHYDGLIPITPTSGHVLDAEGRFSKMVGVAIKLLRRIVDLALLKHDRVIVVMAEGNHDLASSVWLRLMFRALYENEPRVEVLDSELPYYAIQHGLTMLAFHHGHIKKPDQFPLTFAAQYPSMWGQTTKRYAHSGHQHHLYKKEHGGMTVTQHPTLAARDAYASRGGYFAERAATAITYHDEFGQVAENTVCPEMLGVG